MYVNVRYLTRNGVGDPTFDSCVLEFKEYSDADAVAVAELLAKTGFRRKNTKFTNYDEEEFVMPGAIMSMVPCDERGYSRHALEQIKRRQKNE